MIPIILFWSKPFDSKQLAIVNFLCFWKSLLMPGSTVHFFELTFKVLPLMNNCGPGIYNYISILPSKSIIIIHFKGLGFITWNYFFCFIVSYTKPNDSISWKKIISHSSLHYKSSLGLWCHHYQKLWIFITICWICFQSNWCCEMAPQPLRACTDLKQITKWSLSLW